MPGNSLLAKVLIINEINENSLLDLIYNLARTTIHDIYILQKLLAKIMYNILL